MAAGRTQTATEPSEPAGAAASARDRENAAGTAPRCVPEGMVTTQAAMSTGLPSRLRIQAPNERTCGSMTGSGAGAGAATAEALHGPAPSW
jgi:hypothetical protein